MDKLYRLAWDSWNLNHIAKHGISRKEVEEAVNDPKSYLKKHRKRLLIIGSAWGRIITVILENTGGKEYYVVTARDATATEKRIYKRKKK